MDFKKLNKVLSDLDAIRNSYNNSEFTRVEKIIVSEIPSYSGGRQGEEGLWYEVYSIKSMPGIFLKLKITTDSYGENESLAGIQFVQPTEKTVTSYEAI